MKDLKNLRLVCSLWYDLASPYLQQKSQVILQEELFREGTSIKTFLNYIDSLEDKDNVFFRNYKITLLTVDKNIETTIQFWKKIGPSMHSLEMSWCRFKGTEIVRNVMFTWTPNLRNFSLRDCTFYKDIEGSYTVEDKIASTDYCVSVNRNMISLEFYGGECRVGPPLSWMEIITAFPNMKVCFLN